MKIMPNKKLGYDYMFKEIICNEKNPHMIEQFLYNLLKIKINKLEMIKKELLGNELAKKLEAIFKINNDIFVHIMINTEYHSWTRDRSLAYFLNLVGYEGMKNLDAKFINIDINYGMDNEFDCEEYILTNDKNDIYIDNIKLLEYNMDKIVKKFKLLSDDKKINFEYKYLVMLDTDNLNIEKTKKIFKGDDLIMEYINSVEKLKNENKYLNFIESERDWKMRINSVYYEAREELIRKIALNMLDNNYNIKDISEITSLDEDEITDALEE